MTQHSTVECCHLHIPLQECRSDPFPVPVKSPRNSFQEAPQPVTHRDHVTTMPTPIHTAPSLLSAGPTRSRALARARQQILPSFSSPSRSSPSAVMRQPCDCTPRRKNQLLRSAGTAWSPAWSTTRGWACRDHAPIIIRGCAPN